MLLKVYLKTIFLLLQQLNIAAIPYYIIVKTVLKINEINMSLNVCFREMLKNYPSVHQSPYQQSIISECRLLIEKEFPDDSDDEEYQPDKNLEDDDDDDESKCTEVNKSFDNEGDTENEVDSFENTSNVDTNDKVQIILCPTIVKNRR